MKNTSLLLGLCVCALFPINAPGQIDINWMTLPSGAAPNELVPEVQMRFDSIPKALVVDSTTEPPNPFENLTQALYVSSDSAAGARFEAFVRAFAESAARQGSFSIQFRLGSGALTMEVGHTPDPWDPGARGSYGMANNFFGILFQPGSEIQIRGIAVQTDSVLALEANVNYTFTVTWDFEDEKPAYAFFLNGERINSLNGTPYARIADPAEAEKGVTGFRILMGTRETAEGEVFIGQLQSTPSPVDLQK